MQVNKTNQSLSGVERISIITANKLPVILGEKDILKTVQLLPAIKSGGEGQSVFSVRGWKFGPKSYLLDDAPVYNASHLLGFFSTNGALGYFKTLNSNGRDIVIK